MTFTFKIGMFSKQFYYHCEIDINAIAKDLRYTKCAKREFTRSETKK